MTVCVVARGLPVPAWQGDRLILGHLIDGLRARGHRVVVVALTQPDDAAADVAASRARCDRLAVVPDRPRGAFDLARLIARPFPRRAGASRASEAFGTVAALVAEERPDVVHFLGGIQVAPLREAAAGRRRILTPYESHTLWLERAARDATGLARLSFHLRALAAGAYEGRGYRGFDRVVVLSEVDRARLARLDARLALDVIPNGVVAPGAVTPVAERREPLLVFVGNLAYTPNVMAAVRLAREILPRVKRTLPFARLALVGATPAPAVRALAAADVEVTGTVPDVAPWLDRARVFVSPISRGAGLKNKVLEALAAGAPLVATRQSCDGLGTVEGVHVIHAEGANGLAAAAVALMTDDARSQRLATQGRAWVQERFTWPAVVSRYEALYAGRAS
jgi:glycosyltransferase involved in cell wall biosynthesis